jgi:hypothetical protein
MADPEPLAGRAESYDSSFTESGTVRTREVIVVRRRRSTRHRSRNWVAKMSVRRWMWMAAVSGGVLLLMAVGLFLYLGFDR